jgi:beta-1,4-mannosyl-glycoprotein beta-1,4-N-acetylglucosaminyltransferase
MVADTLLSPAPGEPRRTPQWRSRSSPIRLAAALAWRAAGRRGAAIDTLGQLTLAQPRNGDVRAILARCVGEEVLARNPPRLTGAGGGKIFDVFPFNDELHMLKIKLGEMASWVDHFVIVEARATFTGIKKPLVFKQHRREFAEFLPKIIHVTIDAFPEHINCAWAREFYQRDMGVTGLSGVCGAEDVVMITDTDEIVSRAAIESFKESFATLAMERCRYFLNYREKLGRDQQRGLATVWRAGYLSHIGLSLARAALSQHKKARRILDAGWHFTSVADPAGLVRKSKSTSHQELAPVSEAGLQAMIDAIRRGQVEPGWERCELDGRFPDYIRSNRDGLAEYLL